MNKEQIEHLRNQFHDGEYDVRAADELCDVALSALDAQGEPMAWMRGDGGAPPLVLAAVKAHWAKGAFEAYDIPLFRNAPSPAAVQALREAREMLYNGTLSIRNKSEQALIDRIDAILKEQS